MSLETRKIQGQDRAASHRTHQAGPKVFPGLADKSGGRARGPSLRYRRVDVQPGRSCRGGAGAPGSHRRRPRPAPVRPRPVATAPGATLVAMQLRVARLCLDCEEVHDSLECPVCSSESFAYISRWVPVPERRQRPRAEPAQPDAEPSKAETYKQLLAADAAQARDEALGQARSLRGGGAGRGGVAPAAWRWRIGRKTAGAWQ